MRRRTIQSRKRRRMHRRRISKIFQKNIAVLNLLGSSDIGAFGSRYSVIFSRFTPLLEQQTKYSSPAVSGQVNRIEVPDVV